ncbi:MAG: replication factor C large subunit [Nanoarchaeota archaeon]
MLLFTLKYQPRNEQQLFGQDTAVAELKDYILHYKQKPQRAALLLGPIGNGKTSSVYALAKQLNYDLLEINSSDLRNEESMRTFLGSALGQQSLFFRPKIILVDEIDNISGREDRGCIPALIKVLEKSTFPVILTANDISDSKFKALGKSCQQIEYHKLQYRTIGHALRWVCEQENIQYEEKAINTLARQADGDLRGALIDLQVCSGGSSDDSRNNLTSGQVETLSNRKRTETIFNALTLIFKSSSIETALPALEDVDMDLQEVIPWIDENLPKEYLQPAALAKAYEFLSRADIFQGRIRRQQHWRFLVYINSLLTAGISSAKKEKNTNPVQYNRTMRFLRMWQAKMKWAKKKEIAGKLAAATHTSHKVAYEQVPYLEVIFQKSRGKGKEAEEITRELRLEEEEVEWLRR